jgi:cysteine desulfurase
MRRIYLDYNATAPLRPQVRDAMIAAMDFVGNPSSVHSEGRAAKAMVEKARAQIASAFGADGADIVFTSGATEAAALACARRGLRGSDIEHDAVSAWIKPELITHANGRVEIVDATQSVLQAANSETGIVQTLPKGLAVTDATQAFGKLPLAFNWLGAETALISAHKIGGPKICYRKSKVAVRKWAVAQEQKMLLQLPVLGWRQRLRQPIWQLGFGSALKKLETF